VPNEGMALRGLWLVCDDPVVNGKVIEQTQCSDIKTALCVPIACIGSEMLLSFLM